MPHGDFIWCDLSAYTPAKAKAFYGKVLRWSWSEQGGQDIALNGLKPVGAIYQMPEKFIQMGMPSFWMSYIAVDDAAAVAEQATALGGKVELGPEEFPGGGRYALIRDPLGAGFTVLEGEKGARPSSAPGARAGHALFVSDASAVIPFYEALFGWSFGDDTGGVRPVLHGDQVLFHCHEIADPTVRGKEQFWAVLFSAATDPAMITRHGGRIEAEFDLPEGRAIMARDPDNAAFIVLASAGAVQEKIQSGVPWLGWLGVALIAITVLTGHNWPWAIFLGLWAYRALQDEETYLLQRIRKHRETLLYWALIGLYLLLALMALFYPFGG